MARMKSMYNVDRLEMQAKDEEIARLHVHIHELEAIIAALYGATDFVPRMPLDQQMLLARALSHDTEWQAQQPTLAERQRRWDEMKASLEEELRTGFIRGYGPMPPRPVR